MQCSNNSNEIKLAILIICFVACFVTLFTTWSFEMNGKSIPQLRPANVNNSWCAKPYNALKTCQTKQKQGTNNDNDCKRQEHDMHLCENAVVKAYRHLNLGAGCLKHNQMVVVCQIEWCSDNNNPAGQQSCQQECSRVRNALEECIQKQVQSYLPATAK